MQVIRHEGVFAICRGRDGAHRLNMSLLGEQPPGTWVLAHQEWAREVLSAEEAARILDALDALARVMQGGTDIDELFADLAGREPRLPEFLRS